MAWASLIPLALQVASAIGKHAATRKIPTYEEKEYTAELPEEISKLLGTMSEAETGTLGRRYEDISKDVVGSMASRGMYGAGVGTAAQRGITRERSDVLMNLLSKQAQRQLQMIDAINRFGQEEGRYKYGADVGRIQSENQRIQDLIGGLTGGGMMAYGDWRGEDMFKQLTDVLQQGGGVQPSSSGMSPLTMGTPAVPFTPSPVLPATQTSGIDIPAALPEPPAVPNLGPEVETEPAGYLTPLQMQQLGITSRGFLTRYPQQNVSKNKATRYPKYIW